MGDRMRPIPFAAMLTGILEENKKYSTVFGVRRKFCQADSRKLALFGEKLETPFGPAAGPNTQLAQNIVASYVAGSRFFELKTVQVLDGEDLPVSKPCINAEDECYNVEWSTELTVGDAFNEYVKAWILLKIISREWGLGDADGFIFNMSVGYDLKGIQTKKIDDFIEGLKNAADTPIWSECREFLLSHTGLFRKVDAAYIESISPRVCNSITLSTLHGCPPQEIERIATYLVTEKNLNTFIKCNPTLLGYEFARQTMDAMGYDYVAFDDHHFLEDLHMEDAVGIFNRLTKLTQERNLSFGVKLTNTFPVDIKQDELPGSEMYMSGRSLFPLTISLVDKLAQQFDGKLRISYSGGADSHNIAELFSMGVWPITLATNVLKPGGYERMAQIAGKLASCDYKPFTGIDKECVHKFAGAAMRDTHYSKPEKPIPSRKLAEKVPLIDCFTAPCHSGCPIHQDIPAYLRLTNEGRYLEALRVITEKNPLPFITGTICNHNCMTKCMRNFYETPLDIRHMKLIAAEHAWQDMLAVTRPTVASLGRVAIIGGGAAGLSAAYFLSRAGWKVTVFEKSHKLGGIVRNVIPSFRISDEAIAHDIEIVKSYGAEFVTGVERVSVDDLRKQGYEHVIVAIGAWKPGRMPMEYGKAEDVLEFLLAFRQNPAGINLGRHVVVIGGGNTAMDAARAAKRIPGVEKVSLVYRRTKRYMPADEEELTMALEDGVVFEELLAPVGLRDGILKCKRMVLGERDASGRRGVVGTDEIVEVPADTVIAAVGEKVDSDFYKANGIAIDEKGFAIVDAETMETSRKHVYVAGDGSHGPATVVEAIADAARCTAAITGDRNETYEALNANGSYAEAFTRHGVLREASASADEGGRCLECATVCETCVEVCPNRANVAIRVPGKAMAQIVHVDGMCNECGNCATFCPYDSAPYRDKFTLFCNKADFADSRNEGFLCLDRKKELYRVRLGGAVSEIQLSEAGNLHGDILALIRAVQDDYAYLFYKG